MCAIQIWISAFGYTDSITIHAGNGNVFYPAILQFRQHLQPELRPFVLRRPQSQNLLVALQVHRDRHVDRLVLNVSLG
jgi:hypothetical protein